MLVTKFPFWNGSVLVQPGTPLASLPRDKQEWARHARCVREVKTDADPPGDETETETGSDDEPDTDAGDEVPNHAPERLDQTDLDPRIVAELAKLPTPIETVAAARAYLEVHGSFEPLPGIGEAKSDRIVAAIQ